MNTSKRRHDGGVPEAQLSFMDEITVDGFCGGGGWSTGFELAIGRPVDIGINHDAAAIAMHRPHGQYGTVYVLTNYNSTMEENLYRIYTLRDLGFDPYVMIYDKPNAPREIKRLQRWCNNRVVFKSCRKFEEYHG